MKRKRPDALITFVSQLTTAYRQVIIEFATKNRLPTMFGVREDVEAGGLMAYAPNVPDGFRRAAGYVDKILKGAKPGGLPLEQPTKFELVINLKTAGLRALEDLVDVARDRKSTRLNSSHGYISYAVFCLKKKKKHPQHSENRLSADRGDISRRDCLIIAECITGVSKSA